MPKTQKKEYPNTGTLNAQKDQKTQKPTGRVSGNLDINGSKFKINGERQIDSKNRLFIDFSLLSLDTNSVFGNTEVVTEDGVLKLNTQKSKEASPDWRGKFSIGKQGYRISGWRKEHREYGDFISLKVQSEEEYAAIAAQYKEANGEAETPATTDDDEPPF